ncbi:MAG: SPOR domain-containing protein [Gammaproteobacteria bacterium]
MMQAQHNTHTSPGLADFSAALMRANRTARQPVESPSPTVARHNTTASAYDSLANRNISSLISQIRDDGPAGASNDIPKSSARHAAKQGRPDNVNNVDMLDDDVVDIRSMPKHTAVESNDLLELELKMAQSAQQSRSSTGLHFVLIVLITVTAVLGYTVFNLIAQTDELRAAVDVQQGPAAALVPPALIDTASNAQLEQLTGAVQALSSDLITVNTRQQQLQDLVTAIIPDDFEQQLSSLSGIETTVVGLQSDLTTIQKTLQTLKTDKKATIQNKPTSPRQAVAVKKLSSKPALTASSATAAATTLAATTSTVTATTDTDNWIVNLASLSTEQQAQLAVNRLQKSGIAPMIEEAVVNGKRVYRLSVDGFATRDAALVFIAQAKTRLGFSGGWARRG